MLKTCLWVLALSASTPALANPYSDAFGNDSQDAAAAPGDTAGSTAEDALTALRSVSSFPARVHLGDGASASKGWADPDRRAYEPKPVVHHFKAGACAFEVRTGDFTLRRYERNARDELIVSKDPVPRFSTIASETDPVLVSVNTEVYVDVDQAHHKACKALFGARRVKLGTMDLAKTELRAEGDAGGDAQIATVEDPETTTVYLQWDARMDTLALEDASGLAPAVESPVYTVKPPVAGDYYLAVTPALDLSRARSSNFK